MAEQPTGRWAESFSASGRGRQVWVGAGRAQVNDDESPSPVDRIVQLGPLRAVVRADRTVALYDGDAREPVKAYTCDEWAAFVRGVRDGDFDQLVE